MKIINLFKPRAIIMTGIAAGTRGVASIGDVLIAESSWDSGSGKIVSVEGSPAFKPEPRQIPISTELAARFKVIESDNTIVFPIYDAWEGAKPEKPFKVIFGPVASGASVLQDASTAEEIKRLNRKLIGIEMETYGMYVAAETCPNPKPKFVSMKSVCDFADERKSDDYQKYAAYTSSRFMLKYVEDYLEL